MLWNLRCFKNVRLYLCFVSWCSVSVWLIVVLLGVLDSWICLLWRFMKKCSVFLEIWFLSFCFLLCGRWSWWGDWRFFLYWFGWGEILLLFVIIDICGGFWFESYLELRDVFENWIKRCGSYSFVFWVWREMFWWYEFYEVIGNYLFKS